MGKIAEAWEKYGKQRDERIAAEMGRIYKVGFNGMVVSALAAVWYGAMVQRVVDVYGLRSDGVVPYAVSSETVLACGCVLTGLVMLAMQVRRGIADDNRFAESERYPLGFYLAQNALICIVVFVVMVLLRLLAEGQLMGFNSVRFDQAVLISAGFTPVFFALFMLASYLSFRAARKRRAQMASELEEL